MSDPGRGITVTSSSGVPGVHYNTGHQPGHNLTHLPQFPAPSHNIQQQQQQYFSGAVVHQGQLAQPQVHYHLSIAKLRYVMNQNPLPPKSTRTKLTTVTLLGPPWSVWSQLFSSSSSCCSSAQTRAATWWTRGSEPWRQTQDWQDDFRWRHDGLHGEFKLKPGLCL